ncbi:hypothetical protein COLO4_22751 [Corchorus olitorius]|uniref:Uncharacterized protein n=1 Tax=Corchorus olitorius TaxID=93759 RepID=A0A1R3IK99_9ROSI|nr:hypothetical protein COLO4_22751 [Corchorus olitorius]
MSLRQRKPLSDISNSGKPRLSETRKSQAALSDISNSGKPRLPETRKSQAGLSVRKPLSDISNSGKPRLPETRKKNKNQSKKLPILAEAEGSPEPIDCHNHDECIKAQQRSLMIRTSEFLDDFSNVSAEPMSPPCLTPPPSPKPLWDVIHEHLSPLKIKPPPCPEPLYHEKR